MQHAPAKLPFKLHMFAYVEFLAQSLCSLHSDCASKIASWDFLHVNCRQLSKLFFCTDVTMVQAAKLNSRYGPMQLFLWLTWFKPGCLYSMLISSHVKMPRVSIRTYQNCMSNSFKLCQLCVSNGRNLRDNNEVAVLYWRIVRLTSSRHRCSSSNIVRIIGCRPRSSNPNATRLDRNPVMDPRSNSMHQPPGIIGICVLDVVLEWNSPFHIWIPCWLSINYSHTTFKKVSVRGPALFSQNIGMIRRPILNHDRYSVDQDTHESTDHGDHREQKLEYEGVPQTHVFLVFRDFLVADRGLCLSLKAEWEFQNLTHNKFLGDAVGLEKARTYYRPHPENVKVCQRLIIRTLANAGMVGRGMLEPCEFGVGPIITHGLREARELGFYIYVVRPHMKGLIQHHRLRAGCEVASPVLPLTSPGYIIFQHGSREFYGFMQRCVFFLSYIFSSHAPQHHYQVLPRLAELFLIDLVGKSSARRGKISRPYPDPAPYTRRAWRCTCIPLKSKSTAKRNPSLSIPITNPTSPSPSCQQLMINNKMK
ncbi:putative signal peptide protein [Puccinia sorghi]|uniref:Putative signal peptide protein n=1 Tax=Puccinia sorghi TaxID=27349 RepID=A0A0L6USL8_9BASI|nr:putative signal peptide protein [Puccinia sorghi]